MAPMVEYPRSDTLNAYTLESLRYRDTELTENGINLTNKGISNLL